MKRLTTNKAAIVMCTVAAFLFTSCIYDSAGDKFYRTLWTSDDDLLGKITIEFLCGNQVRSCSPLAAGSYCSYESDDMNVRFEHLTLTYDNALVTFIDGWRDGDILHLIWKKDGDLSPQTAILQRLSAYE
jgi:hypothetical protein